MALWGVVSVEGSSGDIPLHNALCLEFTTVYSGAVAFSNFHVWCCGRKLVVNLFKEEVYFLFFDGTCF